MRYLGVDFGKKRIGIAISDGLLAQPMSVVVIKNTDDGVEKVSRIFETEGAERLVLGVSEGRMAEETHDLGQKLKEVGIEVVFWDETLSSKQAVEKLVKSGKGKKIRRDLIDATAAAITLQSYLDEKGEK